MFTGVGERRKENDEITKRNKETFGGDGYVHWLDYGGSLMGEYICENLLKCTLYMYSYCMSFIPQ